MGHSWCGSVDWVPACELIPSLGHMPGLQARSPVVGAQEATTHWCFFPSLSPSPPLSKINKSLKKKKIAMDLQANNEMIY